MATQYYGINRGDTQLHNGVATGSSTTSKDVEVSVNLANVPSKREFLEKMEDLKNEILKTNWPPA